MSCSFRIRVLPMTLLLTVLLAVAKDPADIPFSQAARQPAPELTLASATPELMLREGLAVGLIGAYARSAVPTDLLAWQIATGTFGAPRGGEKYGTDIVRHPVRLREGRNEFLFQGERGRIRARIFEPPASVFFTDSDPTLPDLVIGETGPVWAGIRLVNAIEETVDAVEISYRLGDQTGTVRVAASTPPLMTRKLAVPLALRSPSAEGQVRLALKGRMRAGRREIETPALEVGLEIIFVCCVYFAVVEEVDGLFPIH